MPKSPCRIIDAHQHLVYINNANPEEATLFDIKTYFEDEEVEGAWMLSISDGVIHPLHDYDGAVLTAAADYPGRIIPFAFLDFRKPVSAIDESKACGFAGLKCHFPVKPYNCDEYMPYYARAEALGMPIMFHTGGGYSSDSEKIGFARWTYPDGMLLEHSAVYTLDRIAKYFPRLVLVAAHMGGPSGFNDCIHFARSNANFYFDLSCSPLQRQWHYRFAEVVEMVGSQKILYGSDSRQPGEAVSRRICRENIASFNAADQENILCGNARRLVQAAGYDPRNIRLTPPSSL